MLKRNKLLVPGAQRAIDELKAEIAEELGIEIGPEATARENGELMKRLIAQAKQQLESK